MPTAARSRTRSDGVRSPARMPFARTRSVASWWSVGMNGSATTRPSARPTAATGVPAISPTRTRPSSGGFESSYMAPGVGQPSLTMPGRIRVPMPLAGAGRAFEQEMRQGGVDWQMNVYGGVVHSFTNPESDKRGQPERARYDARADTRSWAEMCAFFGEIFRLPVDARAPMT